MARHKRKRKVAALPKVTVLTANYPNANGREEVMTKPFVLSIMSGLLRAARRSVWELPEQRFRQFTTMHARRWQDCLSKAEH